jgi:Mycothiol maleylpyruvate isomerase N-terminal domain
LTLEKEAALDLEILQTESDRLAAAAAGNLRLMIPSCPGWSMADLVVHTGAVHRAQAAIIRNRATEPAGIAREMFESVPGLLPWLESSTLFGRQSDLDAIPPGLDDWFRA